MPLSSLGRVVVYGQVNPETLRSPGLALKQTHLENLRARGLFGAKHFIPGHQLLDCGDALLKKVSSPVSLTAFANAITS